MRPRLPNALLALALVAATAVLTPSPAAADEDAPPRSADPAPPASLPPLPMSPELAAAAAQSDTYPADYAAAVALARQAWTAARYELAVTGWERAKAVAGENLEVSLGYSYLLTTIGEGLAARRLALRATALAPDSGLAWKNLAWAHRHPPSYGPGSYGSLAAEAAYRRALRLAPDDASAACGLAFTRLAQGDRLGASAAFARAFSQDPSDGCAQAGSAASTPRFRGGGAISLSGLLYQDNPSNKGGLTVLVQGGMSFADLVFFGVSGRFVAISQETTEQPPPPLPGQPPAPPTTATTTYQQGELFGRLGIEHAGAGGQLLIGALRGSSHDSANGIVSGQGWFTVGVTLRGEGAWGSWTDGDSAMFGLGARVPITSFAALDAGLRLSSFHPDDDDSDGVHPSLSLAAAFDLDRLGLEVGGRGGTEIRPLRFDESTVWNTVERPTAGFWLDGEIRILPELGITFGYEVLRLESADPVVTDISHTHVLSVGIVAEGIGELPPMKSFRIIVASLIVALLLPVTAPAATATELYQQSFSLESSGSYAEALARMDQLATAGEDDYLLHLRRGWLLYLNGRYADSVEAYGQALSKSPGMAEARLGQTLPLMALRRWPDAEKVCRELLGVAPGNYLGMSRLAYVLFSEGRFADSETAYRDVLTQYPADNDMRAGLGWSLLRQGKTDAAKTQFQAVLRTVPGHVSAGQGMAAME